MCLADGCEAGGRAGCRQTIMISAKRRVTARLPRGHAAPRLMRRISTVLVVLALSCAFLPFPLQAARGVRGAPVGALRRASPPSAAIVTIKAHDRAGLMPH